MIGFKARRCTCFIVLANALEIFSSQRCRQVISHHASLQFWLQFLRTKA